MRAPRLILALTVALVPSWSSAQGRGPSCFVPVESGEGALLALAQVDDDDQAVLVALSSDLVLTSQDLGLSWSSVASFEALEGPPVLASEGLTVAVIADQLLLLSRDGARSFVEHDLQLAESARAVALLHGGAELLVASGGGLARFVLSDQGPRLQEHGALEGEITALSARGEQVLAAVGGRLRASSDGGRRWRTISGVPRAGEEILSLFVDDQGSAWVLSESGVETVEHGLLGRGARFPRVGVRRPAAIVAASSGPLIIDGGEFGHLRSDCLPRAGAVPHREASAPRRRRPIQGLLPEVGLSATWGFWSGRQGLVITLRWPLVLARPDILAWQVYERTVAEETRLAGERLTRALDGWASGRRALAVSSSAATASELEQATLAARAIEEARIESASPFGGGWRGLDRPALPPLPSLAAGWNR